MAIEKAAKWTAEDEAGIELIRRCFLRCGIGGSWRGWSSPWSYLRDVLDRRRPLHQGDVSDLLPDAWAVRHARIK